MKRLAILPLALLALTLPGCSALGNIGAPQTIANRTTLDERIATLIEQSYQAAGMAIIALDTLHPFSPETKARVKAADKKAYEAVVAVRAAYAAGNASSYSMATAQAQSAITALLALLN